MLERSVEGGEVGDAVGVDFAEEGDGAGESDGELVGGAGMGKGGETGLGDGSGGGCESKGIDLDSVEGRGFSVSSRSNNMRSSMNDG